MPKHTASLPVIALIIASVLWGFNTPFIKLGLETIPPVILISIRFLLAALILLPFAIKTWKPLQRKDLLLLIACSIFYNSVGGLALNVGLSHTTSINAAIISFMAPLLLFILSAEFLKERLQIWTAIGIMTALAGAVAVITHTTSTHGTNSLFGNLLVALSMLCFVLSTLLFKPLLSKTSTFQATFMMFFVGILPVALYALTQLDAWNIHATSQSSIIGLCLSLIAVLGANFLFFYALKHKKVQAVGVYQYIEPIATIGLAAFLLNERPTLVFTIGAIMVFAGIYLAEAKTLRLKPSTRS